ncbi:hypothetical protein MFUL124B02_24700 [Myxococcus fulvus 124B02]|nr:hypothetical protein MFUL124B02_24700 [Myxococcus fulvus 124B02]
MSERAQETRSPASNVDELRHQLEGGLESIESASSSYARLVSALRRSKWRALLWAQPALVAEVLAQDAGCLEALARGLRRAEQEAWPHDAPSVRTLREAKARREELMDRVRKRAEQLTPGFGPPSLEAGLRQLASHARELPTPKKRLDEAFSMQVARVYPWGLTSTGVFYVRYLLIVLLVGPLLVVGLWAALYLFLRAIFGEDAAELMGYVEFFVVAVVSSLSGSQELLDSGTWCEDGAGHLGLAVGERHVAADV